MGWGIRWMLGAVGLLGLAIAASAQEERRPEERGEKVDGYVEWRAGDCLVADAQKVCPAPLHKFEGTKDAPNLASVPLGWELKAKGRRLPDGTLLAREIEVKPNGTAMFENEVRAATDTVEQKVRAAGHFYDDSSGRLKSVGRLREEGPQVERVRGIVDNLLPPYLAPEDVRVYVIENKEWNAFAMGNRSIYVFRGLLDDMDDDEVAIVLGHELVHATHEHSRKQLKKEMWIQLLAVGALSAAGSIDDKTSRAVVELATALTASAWSNGYGRGMEDQADRVGLRYAYESGYDITKGPRLWYRFAKKYGEGNKVVTFFFSDHSRSAARAAKLEKEIAYNYPEGPKPDGPARRAAVPVPAAPPAPTAPAPPAPSGPTNALVATPGTTGAPSRRVEIRPGMTPEEVRRALGNPQSELIFGERTRWTYPDLTVIFEKGRVTEVRF